jgi:hypothetical protein
MANQLKWYKLEAGNSDKGSVGVVIQLQAYSRQEAVDKANHQLAGLDTVECDGMDKGVDYCNVYLAGNLKIHNIISGETCDVEPGSELGDSDEY